MNRLLASTCVGFLLVAGAAGPAALGADGRSVGGSETAAARSRTIVGLLERVETFAESTGWNLAAANRGYEADVSAVLRRAERLNGQRVRATGHFVLRQYNHATVRVFVVTDLRRA